MYYPDMANILPRGTPIRCPRKRHLIGYLNRDFKADAVPRFNFIDFEIGQERIAGEAATCKICGSQYFVQNKTHTQEGWKPSDPQLEPVSHTR